MNDIDFIITGGTIDSVYNPPQEKALPAEQSIVSNYLKNVIQPHITFSAETLCMLDSSDITNELRQKMVERIHNSASERVIITHGTNTMTETANYLREALLGLNKTIVITG